MRRRLKRTAVPSWVGSSEQLKGTTFLAELDDPLPAERSAIWCVALQLALQKAAGESPLIELPADSVKIEVSPRLISGSFQLNLKLDTPFLENDQPLAFRVGN